MLHQKIIFRHVSLRESVAASLFPLLILKLNQGSTFNGALIQVKGDTFL
jgi:hypothetical protein